MEFAVHSAENAEAVDIPDADNYPMIRLLQIYRAFNQTAQKRIPIETKPWVEVSRKTVPIFSAVCFFTARETYKALAAAGTPVALGLVEADWGGTRVEAWTRPVGISKCATGSIKNGTNWMNTCTIKNGTQNECHALFNGMVNPILPMRFNFALWYQVRDISFSALGLCVFDLIAAVLIVAGRSELTKCRQLCVPISCVHRRHACGLRYA